MLNKAVLITGGTGSFGQAITEHLINSEAARPSKIIIFSRGEAAQVEMRRKFDSDRLRFFIGDIRDEDRLKRALQGVDVVVHAAALKHVDVCEYDPIEVKKTNIDGCANIINAAIDSGVKKVLAVSTDKAVSPINAYGCAKAFADRMFLSARAYSEKTKFSVIRFGNFAGSSGSVIPFFQKLYDSGADTLPITDMRMTRFFIRLPEAASRAVEAIKMMEGGEVFCPQMWAFKICDIARAIAPGGILKEIGIRSGEKLHEDLISKEDVDKMRFANGFYITPFIGGESVMEIDEGLSSFDMEGFTSCHELLSLLK